MVRDIYFSEAFKKRERVLQNIIGTLKRLQRDESLPSKFSIAFRGMSGAVVAPIVAYLLDAGLIVVRKPGESAHSGNAIEGETGYDYVIVDDFVSSGATVRAIVATVTGEAPGLKCLGVVTYRDGFFTSGVDMQNGDVVRVWNSNDPH